MYTVAAAIAANSKPTGVATSHHRRSANSTKWSVRPEAVDRAASLDYAVRRWTLSEIGPPPESGTSRWYRESFCISDILEVP